MNAAVDQVIPTMESFLTTELSRDLADKVDRLTHTISMLEGLKQSLMEISMESKTSRELSTLVSEVQDAAIECSCDAVTAALTMKAVCERLQMHQKADKERPSV